ncbi:MAG: hypothetical protein AAF358_14315 [Pseudomonadota bacterium]
MKQSITALFCILFCVAPFVSAGRFDPLRYYTIIDGALEPELIPRGAVVERLFGRFPEYPKSLDFPLADARMLAQTAWDLCHYRAASTERWEALKTPENLADPAAAGRAVMALQEAELAHRDNRWEAVRSELSEPAGRQLDLYLQQKLTPEVRHEIVDFEAMFSEESQTFDNFRRPTGEAKPQPQMSVSIASSGVGESGGVILAGGGFSPDTNTECLRAFVVWLEPTLASSYAAELGLDLSQAGVERFVFDRHPQSYDAVTVEQNRLNMLALADALESVGAGDSAEEAFERHALADRGMDLKSWQSMAQRTNPKRIEQYRKAAAEMYPEVMLENSAKQEWSRYAYLEMQLGDQSTDPACRNSSGYPKSDACRQFLREAYLAYADRSVFNAPSGWREQLLLIRIARTR